MVADALTYHPAIAHYQKFVATTVGRDKALRTVQYFSRFLAWYLYRTNEPQSRVNLFSALKSNLGLVRKALRIGKFVEHFKAAAVAADNKSLDPFLRYCAVGRQLGYGMYLSLDTMTYLDAAGIRKSDSAKTLQREAYRAWMAGLLCSVVSGVYTLYRIREQSAGGKEVFSSDAEKAVEGKKLVRDRKQAQTQLVSDLCDLAAPATALGFVGFDDGFIGLAGTLSSLIGLRAAWAKTA